MDVDGTTKSARRSKRLTDAMTVGAFRTGALAARALPGLAAASLVTPIGLSANFADAERRAMIARHLKRVDPGLRGLALRRAVQGAFDSYARYWIESFRLPRLSARVVDSWFTTEGFRENVVPALERGTGAILALPHLGGWEWAGRWLADQGHPVTAVVEQIDPPELFDWFKKLRADLGMNIVALGPSAGREVLGALKRNEVVCLLSDRDIQRNGVEVEFFGERTTLPAGPATLGLRTGAPVLPAAVYFDDRYLGHHAIVRPPLDTARTEQPLRDDVARVTQALAHELEWLIRRAPDQWHMFQPNWPSDPGYHR